MRYAVNCISSRHTLEFSVSRGDPSTLGASAVDAFYLRTVYETDKGRVVQAAFEELLRGDTSLAPRLCKMRMPLHPSL
jgi:hypothetical protein